MMFRVVFWDILPCKNDCRPTFQGCVLPPSSGIVKKMDLERFNLKQLNEEEVKEQYQVTIKISLQL
jgi:hypothetical protein